MRKNQLRRGLIDAAGKQYLAGELDAHQYERFLRGAKDEAVLERTLRQLETNDGALGAVNWSRLVEWLVENWPTILRIVLSVMVLLETE